jgi:8-oxo-dGTP diphosphatase
MIAPTLQTTAYILSPDRASVLLMHRNKWPGDVHYGKYLGLGGHVERDEDAVTCVEREVFEESGLRVTSMALRGIVTWTDFAGDGRDIMCFVFRVDAFEGEAHEGNEEGALEWVPLAALPDLSMWKSDHEWLPMVFDDDPRQFHGIMPYSNGEMLSWSYRRI